MLYWQADHLRPYQVETSLDLENWMNLGPVQIGNFSNPTLGILVGYVPTKLFYRIRQGAVRPGFDSNNLTSSDDSGSEEATIGFPINFANQTWNTVWVNNNGNITFNDFYNRWTPLPIASTETAMIAPFWADVDTRNPPPSRPSPWTVRYGQGTVEGALAFGVNWADVGYFLGKTDKLNTFQLVLIDRSAGNSAGDFDIEFNYNQIGWNEGDHSNTLDDGYGNGRAARALITDKLGTSMEVRGSGVNFDFLDEVINPNTRTSTGSKNYSNGLIYRAHRNPVPGRYLIRYRNGVPLEDRVILDAGPDPTALINPQRTAFTLRGTSIPPQGSTTSYLWTVVQGSATISSPNLLTTAISLPSFQSATFKLSAVSQSGEMTIYSEDTVILDRAVP
ncbi:MAG: hypothetical protein MUF31_00735 [Akkermansiaceae bacterium]|nr:hypothetical protein [Akkermansiaceae bacterium]